MIIVTKFNSQVKIKSLIYAAILNSFDSISTFEFPAIFNVYKYFSNEVRLDIFESKTPKKVSHKRNGNTFKKHYAQI